MNTDETNGLNETVPVLPVLLVPHIAVRSARRKAKRFLQENLAAIALHLTTQHNN